MKLSLPPAILLALCCYFLACNKPSDTTPNQPAATDTLLAWTKIPTTATGGIEDIWFLNPAKGFFIDGSSLYSSSDSGKTWAKVPGVSDYFINMHLLNAQRGAAIGVKSVYVTNDYTTWYARPTPAIQNNNGPSPDIQFTSAATGYVSSPNGLYKTTDTAGTWNKIYNNAVMGMFFFDDNTGIIFDYTATAPSDFYKTTDGGAHWQPLSYIPKYVNSFNTIQFTDPLHGWFTRFDSLYSSIDGGVTWTAKKAGGIFMDVQFLNAQVGYVAQSNEIYKTTDGGQTWVRSCKISNTGIIEIFFLDDKTGWACCFDGTILRLKQ